MALSALMLSGWLLMAPPQGDLTVVLSQPLATWEQVKAFDTAIACEYLKADLLKDAQSELAGVTPPPVPSEADQREWVKCQQEGYGLDDSLRRRREGQETEQETEEERSVPPFRRKPKNPYEPIFRQVFCESARRSVEYHALPAAERLRREARLPELRAQEQRTKATRCVPAEAVYPMPGKSK